VGREKGKKGICLISFNPISTNKWVYNRYFNPEKVTESILSDTYIFESTYKDNPFLSQAYVAGLEDLKNTDFRKWEVSCNGKWGVPRRDEPFILNFSIDDNVTNVNYDPHLDTFYCVDFNYHNPCILVIQPDVVNDRINVIDEISQDKGFIEELAQVLLDRYDLPTAKVAADMSGFSQKAGQKSGCEIDQLINKLYLPKRSVLTSRPTYNGSLRYLKENVDHSVSHRLCNLAFNKYQVRVNPKCKNLIFDFQDTEWVQDRNGKGVMTKGAGDQANHRNALDCFRYFCQAYLYDARRSKQDLGIE
jgi:phage terminase large subunit